MTAVLRGLVARKPATGRELPELADEVVLGSGDDKHGAVLRAGERARRAARGRPRARTPCAPARRRRGRAPPGRAAPARTSPCVTAPMETSVTTGCPSLEGIAIASGFVPVSGGPPSGCGSRRGEVAVSAATSPPSASRRTQYPSTPVGKQRWATTTRACSRRLASVARTISSSTR